VNFPSRFYIGEIIGHGSLVITSSLVSFSAAVFVEIMSGAATDIVNAASSGIAGWFPALAATLLTSLPSALTAIGVYALVDANASQLRYEAGVLSSHGVGISTIRHVWIATLSLVPLLAYSLGILFFKTLFDSNTTILSVGLFLPLSVAVATILGFPYLRVRAILQSSPSGVMRR